MSSLWKIHKLQDLLCFDCYQPILKRDNARILAVERYVKYVMIASYRVRWFEG